MSVSADGSTWLGVGAAYWPTRNATLLTGVYGPPVTSLGLRGAVSCSDMHSLDLLDTPLIPLDGNEWHDLPKPTQLIAVPSMLDTTDGSNRVGNSFLLTYVYVAPNQTFARRHLVMHDVWLSTNASASETKLALSQWYNTAETDMWTTTAPVPGNHATYSYEALLGYVFTRPTGSATQKLEDCESTWPGNLDHLLTNDGMCESGGYARLRTVGWIYPMSVARPPNTVPLYRCCDSAQLMYFASTNESNPRGNEDHIEWQLG